MSETMSPCQASALSRRRAEKFSVARQDGHCWWRFQVLQDAPGRTYQHLQLFVGDVAGACAASSGPNCVSVALSMRAMRRQAASRVAGLMIGRVAIVRGFRQVILQQIDVASGCKDFLGHGAVLATIRERLNQMRRRDCVRSRYRLIDRTTDARGRCARHGGQTIQQRNEVNGGRTDVDQPGRAMCGKPATEASQGVPVRRGCQPADGSVPR